MEVGRKGAREADLNRERSCIPPDALRALESDANARRWLREVAAGVLDGSISHSVAKAATGALRQWVATLEGELAASEMEALEERVEEIRAELGAGARPWS